MARGSGSADRAVRVARESFLLHGTLDPAVRRMVADSWRRSLASGVDPEQVAPRLELSAPELPSYRRSHRMALAIPVVKRLLLDGLRPDNMVAALTDDAGRLLWVDGARVARAKLDDVGFTAGANWAEGTAGTNAPGVALALDRAVQVAGPEHFARPVQVFSCSAAPVHDPLDGRMIGALDITGGPAVASPHVLALVRATVAAIEAELAVHPLGHDTGVADLMVLGARRGRLRRGGEWRELSLRHSEILTVLAHATDGLGADALSAAIYPDSSAAVTVRSEMSRLRRAVPGLVVDDGPYRLRSPLRTDVHELADLLTAGRLDDAITRYAALLPASTAPGIETLRADLADEVRAAVLNSHDAAVVQRWADGPSGHDDWEVWRRLLDLTPAGSIGATRAQLRLAAIDARYATPTPDHAATHSQRHRA